MQTCSISPKDNATFALGSSRTNGWSNIYLGHADGTYNGLKIINTNGYDRNLVGVDSNGYYKFGNNDECINIVTKYRDADSTGISFKIICGDRPEITFESKYDSENDRLFLFGGHNTSRPYLASMAVYKNTTSSASNVHIGNSGLLYRSTSSSERYKNNISLVDIDELEGLYNLPVKKFKYNDDYITTDDELYNKYLYGFIVEDLEKILPCAVQHTKDENGNDIPEMWNSNIIIPSLLKLIQDLNNRLKELEGDNQNG